MFGKLSATDGTQAGSKYWCFTRVWGFDFSGQICNPERWCLGNDTMTGWMEDQKSWGTWMQRWTDELRKLDEKRAPVSLVFQNPPVIPSEEV